MANRKEQYKTSDLESAYDSGTLQDFVAAHNK